MKVTIEMEYSVDGPRPTDEQIREGVTSTVQHLILSEDVDGTDEWALQLENYTIEITE